MRGRVHQPGSHGAWLPQKSGWAFFVCSLLILFVLLFCRRARDLKLPELFVILLHTFAAEMGVSNGSVAGVEGRCGPLYIRGLRPGSAERTRAHKLTLTASPFLGHIDSTVANDCQLGCTFQQLCDSCVPVFGL